MKTATLLTAGALATGLWLFTRKGETEDELYHVPDTIKNAAEDFPALEVSEAIYENQVSMAQAAIQDGSWYPAETYTPVVTQGGVRTGALDVWGTYHANDVGLGDAPVVPLPSVSMPPIESETPKVPEMNQALVDRFTLAHLGVGGAMGFLNFGFLPALASAIGWEVAEHPLKTQYPGMFPHPSQDSFPNSVMDVVAWMGGWAVGRIAQSKSRTKNVWAASMWIN